MTQIPQPGRAPDWFTSTTPPLPPLPSTHLGDRPPSNSILYLPFSSTLPPASYPVSPATASTATVQRRLTY